MVWWCLRCVHVEQRCSGPRTDYKCCTMRVMIGPWYHDPSLFSFFLLTLFGVSCRDNFLKVPTSGGWDVIFLRPLEIFGSSSRSIGCRVNSRPSGGSMDLRQYFMESRRVFVS